MELKIPVTQLENSKEILTSRMSQSKAEYKDLKIESLDKIIEELEIF